jgi:5,10-methylenetetrahydrofolate reductase
MRARGEVHEDVHLACVANPSLEGSAHGPGRLRAKLEAGAEMVVTQPALIQSNHRAW